MSPTFVTTSPAFRPALPAGPSAATEPSFAPLVPSAMPTPRYACWIVPPSLSCPTIRFTVLDGIAKPRPVPPVVWPVALCDPP